VSTVVDRNLSAARRQVEREAESAEVAQLIAAAGRGDRLAVVRLQERTDALYETYKDRSLHNWVIADANATVLTRAPIDPSVIGQRYTYREWFSGRPDVPAAEAPAVAAPRQQASITRAFRSTAAGRALVVSVASPIWITERDTRRVVGVVSATIHLDTFNQWLVEAEGEKDASGCPARFAVLLNQSQLVRHPCPTAGSPPLPVEPDGYSEREAVQHLWTSANGRSAAFADPLRSDRSYLAAGAALRENPTWRAIVEFDRDHSLAQVNLLDRQFGVIGMVTAGLGLAAVVGLWLMLYRLTRETATARLHQRAPVKGA
jgi:hypothetical protein